MPQLADRLQSARRRFFVGRDEEVALFGRALSGEAGTPQIFHVHGLGGIGKSTLLKELCLRARDAGWMCLQLDGNDLKPVGEDLVRALHAEFYAQTGATSSRYGPDMWALFTQFPARVVLCLDTYEQVQSLDRWVREELVPRLPATALVVLAGRMAPEWGWRSDPGWQGLVAHMPLRNLSPQASRQFLERKAIADWQHDAVLRFTHGHPLALSLVSDLFAQRPDLRFEPETAPDTVKVLLDHLVREVPSPLYRAALEACSLVHWINEELLVTMLCDTREPGGSVGPLLSGVPQPCVSEIASLFEWLRSLSFIASGPRGLYPHDLAREVLAADLHWRDAEGEKLLRQRAHSYYEQCLRCTTGQEQQYVLSDYMYLHRHISLVRPYMDWDDGPRLSLGAAAPEELPVLREMLARHEGEEAARVLEQIYALQPRAVKALRDQQKVVGLMVVLAFSDRFDAEGIEDSALAAIRLYLRKHTPLRPQEVVSVFRFWLADTTYQAVSPAQSQLFANIVQHYLTTPGLAYSFFCCADPQFWSPVASYTDMALLDEASFSSGGNTYGVYVHDWRAIPPNKWMLALAAKENRGDVAEQAVDQSGELPLVTLSKQDFAGAVNQALKDFCKPAMHEGSVLLQSRLVEQHIAASEASISRKRALQELVLDACRCLQEVPRHEKFWRALEQAYIKPAPTQEAAAERLDLPFGTFRRHLKAGVELVTELLWEKEIS